jgi:hypothetical protein
MAIVFIDIFFHQIDEFSKMCKKYNTIVFDFIHLLLFFTSNHRFVLFVNENLGLTY